MSNVNENIRNFRKFRGLSQKELGSRVGKSTNVVSNWENGLHSPDLDTIAEICKVLRVTPNQIFGWEENKEYSAHLRRIKIYQERISELKNEISKMEAELSEAESFKNAEESVSDDNEGH